MSALFSAIVAPRAFHRHHSQGGEIAIALSVRDCLKKTLVHRVRQRHRYSSFVRSSQRKPDVLEREGKSERRRIVFVLGHRCTVNLISWRSEYSCSQHVE